MGNNLTPYSIAIGWEIIYYLTLIFKFTKKKISMRMILISYLIITIFQTVKHYEYIQFIQTMINK